MDAVEEWVQVKMNDLIQMEKLEGEKYNVWSFWSKLYFEPKAHEI